MATAEILIEMYETLTEAFGSQHWWPADTPLEVATGAILTQNTNWPNVTKAIENIKCAKAMTEQKLFEMDVEQLQELIRPSGYYKRKAKAIKNLMNWLFECHDGKIDDLKDISTSQLRQELLEIKGIGFETADSILLYALKRLVFVVDTYSARVAVRHGLIDPELDYMQLQELFTANLPDDIELFGEFHALIVAVGKNFCKPKPNCQMCPLNKFAHDVTCQQ